MPATVLIAIGSNRRHGQYGAPEGVVKAAIAALNETELLVVAQSRVRSTAPMGPRQRRFANALVAVATGLPPVAVLSRLKAIERAFGRRAGRCWGPRVVDLDLIAAGGIVVRPTRPGGLVVPHPGIAVRRFVLDPLVEIAPDWRHPLLHLTARQLRACNRRPRRAAASP